jgi:hypothetical protein
LIPAPGEAAIWNVTGTSIVSMDPYDLVTATDLGLKPDLVDRARAMHDVLGAGSHADHVEYLILQVLAIRPPCGGEQT